MTLSAEKSIKQSKNTSIISISNDYIADHKPDTSQWFTKYYQENTHSESNGLGLGLHMVKKIVEAHDGTVKCSIDPREHFWKVTIQLCLPEITETISHD